MKFMSVNRALIAAAAFGLGVLATPAAQAFTFEYQTPTNSDGAANYLDSDSRFSAGRDRDGKDAPGTYRSGNTTLQFGSRPSFEQRYDNRNMFEPNGRPLGER